jgi:hypothetical protein
MDLWDETEAKEFGEYENLELGGHEIVILDAREHKSDFSGNVSLKISVDIAGNDKQKGFFQKQFDENTSADKKWSSGATKYLSLKDEQLAYLKGFITSLEKSNPGFKFNKKGTWEQLKNLRLAGQFGLEEYEKQDGTIGTATKLVQFRSLDKLKEIKIPKVKKLDGSLVEYEDYKETKIVKNNSNPFGELSDVVEITDNFLD